MNENNIGTINEIAIREGTRPDGPYRDRRGLFWKVWRGDTALIFRTSEAARQYIDATRRLTTSP